MSWAKWHAAAVELQERGLPLRARAAAAAAVRAATSAGKQAESRLVLAWVCHVLGERDECAGLITLARPALPAALVARADCLAGLVLCGDSAHAEAYPVLTAAADALADDPLWRANALVGLGVSAACLRRFAFADRALRTASTIYSGLGMVERAATCTHNRGFVAAQAGDIPTALAHYAAAGIDVARRPEVLLDRAAALLAAGLVSEAGTELARAGKLLGATGRGPAFGEATLAHGWHALRAGDLPTARTAARQATELLPAARLPEAQSLAALADPETPVDPTLADECEQAGQRSVAVELRLAAGLPELVAPERFSDTPELRALGWLAQARLAKTPDEVLAACRAGLGADGGSAELAAAGLAAAMRSGCPRLVFEWVERERSAQVRPRATWDRSANTWRFAGQDLDADGQTHRDENGPAPKREPEVRPTDGPDRPVFDTGVPTQHAPGLRFKEFHGMRIASGAGPDDVDVVVGRAGALEVSAVADEAQAAGTMVLNLFLHCGRMHAVTVVEGHFRLHDLGEADLVEGAAGALWRSAALGAVSDHGQAAVAQAAEVLDSLLLRRIGSAVRPLVVLPTDSLLRVPWAALPGNHGRAVAVAPSAAHWLRARQVRAATTSRLWVAGPGLEHAEAEVAALHRRHGGTLLTGAAATADGVLRAMEGQDTVHIAAHCVRRAEAPLFAAVHLADRSLFGHDLDRLDRPPRVVVLSGCESAVGLPRVLLDRGARAVVAGTVPVPDARSLGLVEALHEHLVAGVDAPDALARAQVRHGDLGFVAFGG
ncbi:CHAT domain-containing protein [Actinokineospora sp. NBRC 105648]|uniref:CHAT domain-containing protein n=1 Tax=Actinokineospora sp. NBRC 105648 TaxID=3032206 RepID=UPI0024A3C6C6|nr:CHAT domain-containing protein [Actinokineospora sp. NBRC 105648]GLZ38278.1 CHAT domain-containing protein [Actinokineospora sp. NBRC 105648]